MSISRVHQHSLMQRAALGISAVLLQWVERSIAKAQSRCPESEEVWKRRIQLEEVARRREAAIAQRCQMPRQF